MMELSGWVGIKDANDAIVEVRDLGPDPIGVKSNVEQIDDRPTASHQWDYENGGWIIPTDLVEIERERRIALPLDVTVSVGTISINMDAPSQRNLSGLAQVGMLLQAQGSSQTTAFRDYANASHDLTPADLVSMGLQVAARIQAVYAFSWALKAMDPIPSDFTDDQYWS